MVKHYIIFVLLMILLNGCRSSVAPDPSTTIRYQVEQPSHVRLEVENSYNTVVAILVDEDKSAGIYHVAFNASALTEGIYYYTLEYIGLNSTYYYRTTKRMLLIK